ncbi:MAG: FKBP-type peptidyl-prolyl cis-trans isomerase, partial [Planctomycetota bacterium]
MEQAKSGDTVKVHYKGKLNDGTVFANSSKREPFEFVIGGEQIIPGFEEAVVGMNPGESKTITVLADSAFGPYHEELVRTIERNKFPEGLAPEVGQRLNLNESDGR